MKVFLSWSGERSKAVAVAMRDWLSLVLHYVEPWMSQHDIAAGERWSIEVAKELEVSDFGIVCLTKENLSAPWLLFEAGALSKKMSTGGVVPYLLNVDFGDILKSPLSLFQGKKADRASTLELIWAINGRAEKPDDEQRLKRLFEATWPDFEKQLNAIPPRHEQPPPAPRPQLELLEDLATEVRGIDQRLNSVDRRLEEMGTTLESLRPRRVDGVYEERDQRGARVLPIVNDRTRECTRLIRVMNDEGMKLSPKGDAKDPATFEQMAASLEAAAKKIRAVELTIPELIGLRERTISVFLATSHASLAVAKATAENNPQAISSAFADLTALAKSNTSIVMDLNAFCQASARTT